MSKQSDVRIVVGYADIRFLTDEAVYRRVRERLPVFRREKADRISQPLIKAQSAGVWLLYETLCRICGKDSLPYNLSHSGNYVMAACVCGHGEYDSWTGGCTDRLLIGCDIEKERAYNDRLAKRSMTQREYEHISALSREEEKKRLFLRCWVMKESVMKALRLGMALDPGNIELAGSHLLTEKAVRVPHVRGEGRSLYIHEMENCPSGMYGAICTSVREAVIEERVILLE